MTATATTEPALDRRRANRHRIARPTATDQLTPQELQIALAVARGQTNRDTAVALSISPGTIEGHLHRIYRKLGLRSRTELAQSLGLRLSLR